jgi:hypothetical protein
MKSLTDPGKDKTEKEARIKALVAPLVGETVGGKKITATARKKAKDTLRADRKAVWEATLS